MSSKRIRLTCDWKLLSTILLFAAIKPDTVKIPPPNRSPANKYKTCKDYRAQQYVVHTHIQDTNKLSDNPSRQRVRLFRKVRFALSHFRTCDVHKEPPPRCTREVRQNCFLGSIVCMCPFTGLRVVAFPMISPLWQNDYRFLVNFFCLLYWSFDWYVCLFILNIKKSSSDKKS